MIQVSGNLHPGLEWPRKMWWSKTGRWGSKLSPFENYISSNQKCTGKTIEEISQHTNLLKSILRSFDAQKR